MKRRIPLICIIAAAALFSACQRTPEKEFVVQKNQGDMIEAAQPGESVQTDESKRASITIQTADTPETYTKTFSSGRLNVDVNAKVNVPDCGALPIVRVEGADFSQEQVTLLFNYFCGDIKMYTAADEMTKDVLENQIVNLKALIVQEENSEDTDPADLERYRRQLSEAQKALPGAPTKIEKIQADGALKTISEYHPVTKAEVGRYTVLAAAGGDKSFRVINNSDRQEAISYVHEDGSGGGGKALRTMAKLAYADQSMHLSFGMGNRVPVDENTTQEQLPALSNLRTTPLQARQMAESMINELGLSMMVKNMYLIDDKHNDGGEFYDAKNYAYEIECARVVAGAGCAVVAGSATGGSIGADQFAPPASWFYESFVLRITDDDIISLEWVSPTKILDTVVEDCELLSFNDIQNVFEKMMSTIYEFKANQSEEGETTVSIYSTELELVRISEQNSIKNGLLVPTWRFYGAYGGPQTENECFLTINAVDGSIIDTYVGY